MLIHHRKKTANRNNSLPSRARGRRSQLSKQEDEVNRLAISFMPRWSSLDAIVEQ